MNRLRWSLLLGYVMATMLAYHAHDHQAAQADPAEDSCPTTGEAPCGESRAHLHQGSTANHSAHTDHCLACQFRSVHQADLTSRIVPRAGAAHHLLDPADAPFTTASIARPTGRGPPRV